MSDGGKGSKQRPGNGYASGWDAIFGKKKFTNEPIFELGQSVVFKMDDSSHKLDYLRNYNISNMAIEKKPDGKCLVSLFGENGYYNQHLFEDFNVWASHQRLVSK